jgi:hypothetical protein
MTTNTTFSCFTAMDLEPIAEIAGNPLELTFNMYDVSGSAIDLTGAVTSYKLSPYGQSGYVALDVPGVLSGSSFPNQFIVTTGSLTRPLEGKYVGQPCIIDFTGLEFRPSQGTVVLYARNSNT